jgi:hypothetical protein
MAIATMKGVSIALWGFLGPAIEWQNDSRGSGVQFPRKTPRFWGPTTKVSSFDGTLLMTPDTAFLALVRCFVPFLTIVDHGYWTTRPDRIRPKEQKRFFKCWRLPWDKNIVFLWRRDGSWRAADVLFAPYSWQFWPLVLSCVNMVTIINVWLVSGLLWLQREFWIGQGQSPTSQ